MRALRDVEGQTASKQETLDRIVRLAQILCDTAVALLALIDADRQRIVAAVGTRWAKLDRNDPFCAGTIAQGDVFTVPDALADARFQGSSFVANDPPMRFYAGVPVRTRDGHPVAALCVLDPQAGNLDATREGRLRDLAAMIEDTLTGTRWDTPDTPAAESISDTEAAVLLRNAATLADLGYWIWDHDQNRLVYASQEAAQIHGLTLADYFAELGDPERMFAWFHPEDRDAYRRLWIERARAGRRYEMEVRVLRRNGCVRTCREVGAPIHDSTGHLRHTVGTLHDITSEKRRERDLADHVRQQSIAADLGTKALAAHDPDALIDVVLDRSAETLGASFALFCQFDDDRTPLRCAVRAFGDAPRPDAEPAPDTVEVEASYAQRGTTFRFTTDTESSVLNLAHSVEGIVTPVYSANLAGGFLAFYREDGGFPVHVNPFLKAVTNTLAVALDRLASDAARRETMSQLAEVANAIPGMIFRRWHAPDGRIFYDYLSERCAEIFGVSPQPGSKPAQTLLQRVHPEDRPQVERRLFRITPESVPGEIEFRIFGRSDEIRWVRTTFTVTPFDDGWIRVDGVDLDVTDRRRAEERAEYSEFYDPTTDLPNRALVERRLEAAIASAGATGRKVGVAMLDLDGFSRINSVYGRSVGDRLLRQVGSWLQQEAWSRDTIARTAGDQFTIVFHALRESSDKHRLIGKLFRSLNRTFPVTDADSLEGIRPTACIGFAIYPRDGVTAEGLLDAADSALAEARQQGPASYALYTPAFTRATKQYVEIERELRRAIDREEFELYYQPQLDAGSQRVTGAEALMRWRHPERGLLTPGSFIEVAEKSGLIQPITHLVLRQACHTVAAWRGRGLAPPRLAVNLSGRDLEHDDLISQVTGMIAAAGIPGAALEVELTETAVVADIQTAADTMQGLADLGVQIAIDDFGTGYSSLKYLTHLPFDRLKIDRTFTSTLGMQTPDDRVVRMIVGLAQGLEKRVVAEGVETAGQAQTLAELGVHELQGFAFSPPLPEAAFRNFRAHGVLSSPP
mgnify:FL=1